MLYAKSKTIGLKRKANRISFLVHLVVLLGHLPFYAVENPRKQQITIKCANFLFSFLLWSPLICVYHRWNLRHKRSVCFTLSSLDIKSTAPLLEKSVIKVVLFHTRIDD